MKRPSPRSIRIFLASSAELKEHRDAFDLHVRQLNDRWIKGGLHLEPVRWENFLDAMDARGLQSTYNKEAKACDIFVMLYRTKVGKYTVQEFETAFGQFQETGKPRIYTYFHHTKVDPVADREGLHSLWAFQDKLRELKHYQTNYENVKALLLHFREQLDKLYNAGAFGAPIDPAPAPSQAGAPATSITPYLARRANHWSQSAAGHLDQRFVNLTLMVDHGLEYDGPRHESQGRYSLLSALLAERHDVGAWVLVGVPGSGKSTVLQHHEMSTADAARAALEALPGGGADVTPTRTPPTKPEVCIWHRLSEYDADKSPPPAEWLTMPTRWPHDLPPPDALRRAAHVRFLLDGLNEIKASTREKQLEAVAAWTEWAAAVAARGDGLAPVFSVRTLDQSPMSASGFEVRQVVLAPWDAPQIAAYCQAQLGDDNALWPTIERDAALLELSRLPFNLWAQCALFTALGRAARDRAELMSGLFWQVLAKRVNDAPLKVPGLVGERTRKLIASGDWKKTPRALPDDEGCLVPWLDDALQRLHRQGRQVSVTQADLLTGLQVRPGKATADDWLYAVRSLQLVDEGGHDEFSAQPLLRCTHKLWQEFFAARGIRDWATSQPDHLPDLTPPPLQPVVGICQFEAQAYARWLQAQSGQPVRLPLEAEWEAAARGHQRRPWPWGEPSPDTWQINADPSHLRRTSPVGVFVQGDSPDGLTDLAGNVWEWTTSLYTEWHDSRALIEQAPDGLARRVVRGGSWLNPPELCRTSYRYGFSPGIRSDFLGFRLVSSCPIQNPEP